MLCFCVFSSSNVFGRFGTLRSPRQERGNTYSLILEGHKALCVRASQAHVSPLSVAARAAKQSKFIQKNYKLRQSSQRALHAIASVGELVADIHTQYVAKESVLKSRKKKKKKNKTKSDKKVMRNCGDVAKSV